MNRILVSFIVPAYNVDKYIEQCIMSIIEQDYRNIEIIVVDDGSQDQTGEIIDEIAITDGRVRPVHQSNAGVSAARNAGMDIAKGEYVVFVDGDDYIAPNYTDYMLCLALDNNADFVLSLNCYTRKGEEQINNDLVKCIDGEEATALLLGPRVIVGCWNKIYKTTLLKKNNIRFSEDLCYGEGLHFISKVAQTAEIVAVGRKKVYYYRRNNYASACSQFRIENFHNGLKAIDAIENDLLIKTLRIFNVLAWHRCQFKMGVVIRMKSANSDRQYSLFYKECLKYVRQHALKILLLGDIGLYKKSLIIGTSISPTIMAKLDKWRRKRIQENSIC